MRHLNSEQQRAVCDIDGPLLVLAGAGSGKTRVITEKIAYLIQVCEYKAKHILALTFTNKAAKEMGTRVGNRLTQAQKRGLSVATFHTFGLNFLRKHADDAGYKKNFSLFDEQDSLTLIHEIAYQAFQTTKQNARDIKHQISLWKNALMHPEAVMLDEDNAFHKHAYEVYVQYQRSLKAYNAVDFDDLVLLPVNVLQENHQLRERWQQKLHYILVDEYQDTNHSQYQLLKLLSGVRRKFTVVGDDDQSIYAWRGACPKNLAGLQKDYPTLKVIKLEQNYRSSGRILHVANTLIDHNPHLFTKKLWSAHGYGEVIRVILCKHEEDEAQRIASEILTHKLHHQNRFCDYAVLLRGNHQSFLLERYFQLYKIPYVISGGSSFFAKAEIKDVLAYFKLMLNPDDDCAFLRVVNTPRREIGPATLEKLGNYASKRHMPLFHAIGEMALQAHLSPAAIQKLQHFQNFIHHYRLKIQSTTCDLPATLLQLLEDIHYKDWLIDNANTLKQAEKRFENVTELVHWIFEKSKEGATNVHEDFAETIHRMLLTDIIDREADEKDDNKVQILTIHAAKGLEFPHVHIAGFEEGILPHWQSIEENCIEEERRLAYVALTRARSSLTLTLTKARKKFNELAPSTPSRFLEELPQEDLKWIGRADSSQSARKNLAKSNIAVLKNRFKKGKDTV